MESSLTIELEVDFQIEIDCEDFLDQNETFKIFFVWKWLVITRFAYALLIS